MYTAVVTLVGTRVAPVSSLVDPCCGSVMFVGVGVAASGSVSNVAVSAAAWCTTWAESRVFWP